MRQILIEKSRADKQHLFMLEQQDTAFDIAFPAFWLEGIGKTIGENSLDPTFENGRHAYEPYRINDG